MWYSELLTPLFSDPDVRLILSDEQFTVSMLDVELALADVQEALGIIPVGSAEEIKSSISEFDLDTQRALERIPKDGVPVIELVKQLRETIDEQVASYLHWGATSQDIMDTARVLQLRSVIGILEPQLIRVMQNLAVLADAHRHTLMAGRTHSQHALPITFGVKVAGWIEPLLRHKKRLDELKPRLLVVQLGGAVGTLASFGSQGQAVRQALAKVLDLGISNTTWHTQRDSFAELANWLSLVTGSLAKIATDIILLAQSEVSEVRESNDITHGGSSTMPQKQNPILSENIIAAARTNASLLANMHHALIQEHERATGSWQIEWINLPTMIMLTTSALNHAEFLSKNLVVDVERMSANVRASNGIKLAEAIDLALTEHMGRTAAKDLIKSCIQTVYAENRHLVDIVREKVDYPIDWESLRNERNYLGESLAMVDALLEKVQVLNNDE